VVLGRERRQHIGRVIVVGADNEYIPQAAGLRDGAQHGGRAVRAKNGQNKTLDITLLARAADRDG
jgi:hypothetical protein